MNISAILLAATSLLAAPGATKPENAPTRVLLVTGVDYAGHHWKETAPVVRNLLEQDKRFEVRIVEDPEFLATPVVFDYDAIILHFKNYKPLVRAAAARENLTTFVKQGKGLVLLHFACGAFEDWPEFRQLAGKVWDGTSHDPRGPFQVKIVDPNHPITRGMKDFDADDELYTCLTGDRKVQILAVARSKVKGADQPMAFVFDYGKGRVFHTPLGHDVKALQMPGVAELIRRGTAWAAGRQ
jgi:type 1 glutamine amidotransferase